MRRLMIGAIAVTIATAGLITLAVSQEYTPANDPELAAVAAALGGTPHSLASAIAQVATGGEVPIEAKFEIEDGVLMLSVYTSEKGLDVMAEENVFKEYKGDATAAQWAPAIEVFTDFEHIARSAQYHTLLSMTSVTILDVIERASALGTVFSVKPMVVDGHAHFEVLTAEGGTVTQTLYDLSTGEVYVGAGNPPAAAGNPPPAQGGNPPAAPAGNPPAAPGNPPPAEVGNPPAPGYTPPAPPAP